MNKVLIIISIMMLTGCISSLKTDWTDEIVIKTYNGVSYIECTQLGLREDGVLVWRDKIDCKGEINVDKKDSSKENDK